MSSLTPESAMRWTTRSVRMASCLALVSTVAALAQASRPPRIVCSAVQAAESNNKANSEIVAEDPEPLGQREREARTAKNVRYNAGGTDLTTQRQRDSEIFFEQVWPAVDFIPAAESALVATGKVVRVQSYLSQDRSRIYTEATVAVDHLLKRDRDDLLSVTRTVIIDRLGGAIKLKGGRVVRD